MSDNPRTSGHPSDIPSSRYNDTLSGSSGSRGPTGDGLTTPPVSAGSSPGGGHHSRNIILGAIATVIASTSVYYLTQYINNRKTTDAEPSHLEMKEATTSAWKSYIAYENAYTKNTLSYEKEMTTYGGLDYYLTGFKAESAKFQKDLEDLQKSKKIDKDLAKALNRRLENERAIVPKFEEYISNVKKIFSDTIDVKKKTAVLIDGELKWINYYKGLFERGINDIQEIAKTLSERYGYTFNMNDFLVVQLFPDRMKKADSMILAFQKTINPDSANSVPPATAPPIEFASHVNASALVGNWNANGAVFTFSKNGKLKWVSAGGSNVGTGTWKIEKDKLKLEGIISTDKEKFTWIFRLSRIKPDSFTITADGEPYTLHYNLVRIPVN